MLRSVEQQDAGRQIASAPPESGLIQRIAPAERRQMVGIGKVAERHQAIPIRSASAASVMSRTGTVSVTPTRK